jgi:hypothetical protein
MPWPRQDGIVPPPHMPAKSEPSGNSMRPAPTGSSPANAITSPIESGECISRSASDRRSRGSAAPKTRSCTSTSSPAPA